MEMTVLNVVDVVVLGDHLFPLPPSPSWDSFVGKSGLGGDSTDCVDWLSFDSPLLAFLPPHPRLRAFFRVEEPSESLLLP